MRINIRSLVKELLENENLIVNYNELNDGGFDLSVRINEELSTSGYVNTDNDAELPSYKTSTNITHNNNDIFCPNCGGSDVVVMYGKATLDGKPTATHYICNKCHKEFDVKE